MSGKKNQKSATAQLYSSFPALIILTVVMVFVTVVYFNSSLGWFASNKTLTGSGMSVQVEVSPNLVVSDSASTIATYTQAGWNDSYIEKVWNESPPELFPADHYTSSDYPAVDGTNSFDLVYNTNPENVVRTTGKGEDLTFAHVPADGEDIYFIDRIVYISSLNKPMTKGADYSSITISIAEVGTGTTTNSAYKSASADVYVSGMFIGTLNLDTLNSITVPNLDIIPLNTSGSISITFRCYFDGALQVAGNAAKNYVNSSDLAVNTADISMDFTIEAA